MEQITEQQAYEMCKTDEVIQQVFNNAKLNSTVFSFDILWKQAETTNNEWWTSAHATKQQIIDYMRYWVCTLWAFLTLEAHWKPDQRKYFVKIKCTRPGVRGDITLTYSVRNFIFLTDSSSLVIELNREMEYNLSKRDAPVHLYVKMEPCAFSEFVLPKYDFSDTWSCPVSFCWDTATRSTIDNSTWTWPQYLSRRYIILKDASYSNIVKEIQDNLIDQKGQD